YLYYAGYFARPPTESEKAERSGDMAKKKEKTKLERINEEERKLKRNYKELQKNVSNVTAGLIRRAAYMKVTLEDYEKDLDENGYVEMFSQSEKQEPYERERPVARLYNTMNKNYQNIIKVLVSLLPKQDPKPKDDGFDMFIRSRND
ncbi:MAG: hypothetical protein M0P10_06855, partial [Sphaerochaetaceae bacterium]|nr:hypothetical protein [Sphaerochaetaceae bacterium]